MSLQELDSFYPSSVRSPAEKRADKIYWASAEMKAFLYGKLSTVSPASLSAYKTELKHAARGKCPCPVGRILKNGVFYPVACKSWKCLHCAAVKKLKLIKRFETYKKSGVRYRMLTLTELKHPSNFENAKELTKHWARLRASLRKHGIPVTDYFWTKEYKPLHNPFGHYNDFTCPDCENVCEPLDLHCENDSFKNDDIEFIGDFHFSCRVCGHVFEDVDEKDFDINLLYPHLHILVPAYIDVNLIRRLWFLATERTADQVNIPDDENNIIKNPVAYMTKYFSKSDMQLGFSKGERRYGCSRNYPARELEQKYSFDIAGVHYEGVYVPYSGGGGIFIFNKWKVPDNEWLKIGAAKDKLDLAVQVRWGKNARCY